MGAPNPSKPYDDAEWQEDEDADQWPACPMCNADSLFEVGPGIIRCLACGETFAEV